MSWRDEDEGRRAAWQGSRHDQDHLRRMGRGRFESWTPPDRAYARGYEEELERQERERREEREAKERADLARQREQERMEQAWREEAAEREEYERMMWDEMEPDPEDAEPRCKRCGGPTSSEEPVCEDCGRGHE